MQIKRSGGGGKQGVKIRKEGHERQRGGWETKRLGEWPKGWVSRKNSKPDSHLFDILHCDQFFHITKNVMNLTKCTTEPHFIYNIKT